MLVSMLGLLVSVFWVWPYSRNWGVTFTIMFGIFFVAAVYNFTHSPDEDTLAVHEPVRHLKHVKAYRR